MGPEDRERVCASVLRMAMAALPAPAPAPPPQPAGLAPAAALPEAVHAPPPRLPFVPLAAPPPDPDLTEDMAGDFLASLTPPDALTEAGTTEPTHDGSCFFDLVRTDAKTEAAPPEERKDEPEDAEAAASTERGPVAGAAADQQYAGLFGWSENSVGLWK
jgi:hypothetical protein